ERWPAPAPPQALVTRPPAWGSGAWAAERCSASAQAARLIAALRSRSTTSPHPPSSRPQRKVRSANVRASLRRPHPEQVFVEAKNRGATASSVPYHAAL